MDLLISNELVTISPKFCAYTGEVYVSVPFLCGYNSSSGIPSVDLYLIHIPLLIKIGCVRFT